MVVGLALEVGDGDGSADGFGVGRGLVGDGEGRELSARIRNAAEATMDLATRLTS